MDHVTIAQFAAHLEGNLESLSTSLQDGSYRPQAIRRVWIPKPGSSEKRPLGIPTVRDRVVQGALRQRPGADLRTGLRSSQLRIPSGEKHQGRLAAVSKLLEDGYTHVVDADLRSYYDTIPRQGLLARIEAKVSDGRVLDLVRAFLDQEVMDGLEHWTPEEGTPQGAVLSPLLSNIYLDPLDHLMADAGL